MTKLERGHMIKLLPKGGNRYAITTWFNEPLVDAEEPYSIYLKNITFFQGTIRGFYLGADPVHLLSDDHDTVEFDGESFNIGNEPVKKARMITVENGHKVAIVIPED